MSALLWLSLASTPAHAAVLEWRWAQDAPVQLHAETFINTPVGAHFRAASNVDARALSVGIVADLSCTGSEEKKGTAVVCTISKIDLEGRAFDGEQAKLDDVLRSYDDAMTGARIEMRVRPDGQIQSLEVEGIPTDIAQARRALEHMRQLARKMMSPMGVTLPKDGVVAKPWKHKGMPLFFELISSSGTTGGVAHQYRVDGDAPGGGVFVIGEGRGNLNTQNQTQGATSAGALNMVGATQTRFDAEGGLPLYSEVSVTGTPSAANGALVGGVRYALAAWVGQVHPDGSVEGLEGPRAPGK